MATFTTERTVVGLFNDMADAQNAVSELENAGIARRDINIVAGNESGRYNSYTDTDSAAKGAGKGAGAGAAIGGGLGLVAGLTALAIPGFGPVIAAGPIAAALTGAGIGAAAGGLIGGLTNAGVPKEHAEFYAEGVRRGGVLVTVKTDDRKAERAADILDAAGAQDVDEQAKHWNVRGTDREQRIPVVEETLDVDKREVRRGGVRVFSEVHTQPVQENVNLREEKVTVDRRPTDRPATTADFEAFREGSIDVVETSEEPVVKKRARVKEEVVVKKDVSQRTETVRDSVRHTDVRVEPLGTDYHADFRTDFERRYPGGKYRYEEYMPAYEFGYRQANDTRYSNQDWSRVEPTLRSDWETRGHGKWEDFKDSIRYGWDRVRGRA